MRDFRTTDIVAEERRFQRAERLRAVQAEDAELVRRGDAMLARMQRERELAVVPVLVWDWTI